MVVVYCIIGCYVGGGWVVVKVNFDELVVVVLFIVFNCEIDGLWRGVL